MTFLRPTLLTLACLLASPGFADDLPSLGDASSAIVSPQQEYQLGRAWLAMLRSQVSQLNDPLLKDYVETSVYKLVETSQVNDRRLEFILINSPQLNAFAAPGGIVGVNGGLFLNAQTESEYASVLAHELAHVSQRHFARGVEASQRMQIPMMAALLGGIIVAAAGAGDAGIAAIASTQAAAIQEQLRFSREKEQEADRIGMLNLEKAGYDPRSMPTMFERLMRQYRFNAKPPEFLLTHPVTESRIADTRNRAEQFKPGGKEDSLTYQLIRARVQLFYEDSPGLAAKRFRAQLDENPKSDVARYGLAIAQIKGSLFNDARENLKQLLAKSPDEIIYNLAQVDLDIANSRLPDAQARVDRMLVQYPRNYPLNQVRVDLLLKQNRPADAEKALEALLKNRPNDPDVWYMVAETRGQSGNIIGLHQARAEYFALIGDYRQAIQQLDFAKRRAGTNFPLSSRIDARQRELMEQERLVKDMMG
ncbi:peptidase M48 [Pseudomonas sp. FW306-02-F02-AA]|uniref:Putative beta-barrel assembly-enhancing protease n=1 Tax=Pseudomonas fluorescens TaxID=294 RepID=A0A0N9VWH4_PSEFL|nr:MULTISPECIES: M48 family metalloprotease [Pseudomonas]ALI02816.1 peptidase M48 [Pseudomonas fluorescens]PMZ04247.1 peptidase M48 [Pseudomonas sp. FW306-02-F02-AB]PMZ10669.1 peptidase M48 [Pseudomonas sp. FW306-02-H06C]PMZ16063.1 peptidase M48 [Pseudomonas sp. FW306-02-F02-AA]PMZ21991.1 peptidase M48 [Pseudomonas sp. FW306-02-F08-AA]